MSQPPLGLRVLLLVLLLALGVLQVRLWLSEDGWSEVLRLRNSVATQVEQNQVMTERNSRLRAEVSDLKSGFSAVEERARADLGMIGNDESFYLLVPAGESSAAGAAANSDRFSD